MKVFPFACTYFDGADPATGVNVTLELVVPNLERLEGGTLFVIPTDGAAFEAILPEVLLPGGLWVPFPYCDEVVKWVPVPDTEPRTPPTAWAPATTSPNPMKIPCACLGLRLTASGGAMATPGDPGDPDADPPVPPTLPTAATGLKAYVIL